MVTVRCPVITDPDAGLADPADFDPLIARLAPSAPGVPSGEVFPRGAVQPDGRLDLCKQGVGPVQAGRLTAAAVASPLVRHLLLGTNGLGAEGAAAVAGALPSGHGIETLYLGCNRIDADAVGPIADRLGQVRALWLKRNPLGDQGVARLAAALSGNTSLRTLDLVNTGLTGTGLTVLASVLRTDGPRLERLYLGGNGLDRSAVPVLAQLIHDAGIRELYLAANHLGDDGVAELAAAADGVAMTFGLGGNGLTPYGISALTPHLRAWPVLDLARPPSERALGATGNRVGDEGAAALAEVLPSARLRRLDLRRTGIGGRGARRLADAVAGHPTLEYLGLAEGVPRRIRRELTAALGQRPEPHPDVRAIASIYR